MGLGDQSGVVHPSPDPFPQGKGSLSALISCDGDFLGNYLQHPFHIPQHLVVPKADHAVAVGFDDAGSVRVAGAFGMLSTVQFNRETQATASEVGDEVTDGVLAGKFGVVELASAQVAPEARLRLGRFATQLASEASQALLSHRRTPIPNPFPTGKGHTFLSAIFATLSTASLAQNPAMTPPPVAQWPGAEIAPGVAFQGDGSVSLERTEAGLPVLLFWRPILFHEDTKRPVAGRMDCKVIASDGAFSQEAFDPETRHAATADARAAQGFRDMDRLRDNSDTTRQLDIVGRRANPRQHYVLSYILVRDGARLIDIRRNCTFVYGKGVSKPDVLPYVYRYTRIAYAFEPDDGSRRDAIEGGTG